MSAAPGPAVATGGSDEAFSIKVESFKEIGTDYIWTLRLKGFEKNQWIYIYDKDEKGKNKPLKGFGGCKIVDLDAQVVRVKASLIVPSKLVEYEFRSVFTACASDAAVVLPCTLWYNAQQLCRFSHVVHAQGVPERVDIGVELGE